MSNPYEPPSELQQLGDGGDDSEHRPLLLFMLGLAMLAGVALLFAAREVLP